MIGDCDYNWHPQYSIANEIYFYKELLDQIYIPRSDLLQISEQGDATARCDGTFTLDLAVGGAAGFDVDTNDESKFILNRNANSDQGA